MNSVSTFVLLVEYNEQTYRDEYSVERPNGRLSMRHPWLLRRQFVDLRINKIDRFNELAHRLSSMYLDQEKYYEMYFDWH
jgi:hypothetical protein